MDIKRKYVFNILGGLIFLTMSLVVFAGASDEPLISVIISQSGTRSYLSLSPLYYEAKRKGIGSIQIPSGISPHQKRGVFKPMQLNIYSTCEREYPKKGSDLGLRPQFLHSSLLLAPHSDDLPAASYLLPRGFFRMLKEVIRGRPYFKEEGTVKIFDRDIEWPVNITRSDVTATNSQTDYFIEFSNVTDQPVFIQALKAAAKLVGKNKIPQVVVLLTSPSLYVKATYALIHRGTKNYQNIKLINIVDWWNKQQRWCHGK